MTVLALATLGIAGLVVLAVAVLALLVSLLHPEGRRRPGGYLDGEAPRPGENLRGDADDDATDRSPARPPY